MGFFRKNPNESAYTGGKKHWTDIIKNTDIRGSLVWRQPEEDFNTRSTLIVNPGEQAVFIKGGVIQEVFDNGTYQLSTENYPFISRLRNAFSGGISAFNCFVYFVRTTSSQEILWGTESPLQVRDPKTRMRTELRMRGAYRIKVGDAGTFLQTTLGNGMSSFMAEDIRDFCKNEFLEKIMSEITKAIEQSDREILGITNRLTEFSAMITPQLSDVMTAKGIELQNFSISAIDIISNKHIDKYETAVSDVAVMDVLGDRWGAQQQVDIMKAFANNAGNSSAGAEIAAGLVAGAGIFHNGKQVFQGGIQTTPPPPPPIQQYYLYVNGQQMGPMPMQQLAMCVNSGQLTPATLVWRDGLTQWVQAATLPELAHLFAAPTAPPVPASV